MSKSFVTNVAGYCGAAVLSVYPLQSTASTGFDSSRNVSYNYSESKFSSNTNSETVISNSIDIYQLEANSIISEIENTLGILVDDTFIPNKSEDNVTLFITCKEFRDFCENENYQEAYDLELRIKASLENELNNSDKIGRIAFL